jgi:aryl-alcohol dehydrogenase-like predicted oxidoreductase
VTRASSEENDMATTLETASAAGTFRIGGEIEVNRLGYGAMRITGKGIWGEPADRDECLRTLARLPELGVNFIDTADSYGPNVSEPLIREALHPYDGLLIATKAGLLRPGPDQWTPNGDPAYLHKQAEGSCERLGVDRIDLWQLHRIDPRTPRKTQFEAVAKLIDDGVIRFAGLSEVSVADIKEASDYFPVATVQNRYNLTDRGSEDVLDYCEAHGIGFIPWFPLASGDLAREGALLDTIARAHDATPAQIALAWTLKRSPVMLPIPGTSKVAHLEQNVAAAAITLSDEEFASLDKAGRA